MSHARLYIADTPESAQIPDALRTQSVDSEHFLRERFGIDDARALSERAHIRAITGERNFLVHFGTITSEAQNALLKLFEEPPENTVFHVVVRHEEILLPTLRSRLLHTGGAPAPSSIEGVGFASLSYAERLAEIAARAKKKDMVWFESVAAEAEQVAATLTDSTLRRQMLTSVLLVRKYLGARGASTKMLLEEIALSLPQK